MPTSYTWIIAAGASGSSAGSPGALLDSYGTGADERTPYAFSRRMDAMTGDAIFDASRRSWALGAPLAERVLRCLRVERGQALRDPSYGVDWSPAENARTNSSVAAKQAISVALKRFVDRGEIVDLVVEVSTTDAAGGKAFLFKIAFRDPRGTVYKLTGRPRA